MASRSQRLILLLAGLATASALFVAARAVRSSLPGLTEGEDRFATTGSQSVGEPFRLGPEAQSGREQPPGSAGPTTTEGGTHAPIDIDLRRRQLIGVRTARVERTEAVKTIRAVGIVRHDETRLADVNLKVDGWVRELYVDYTGAFVRKGQPLFALYSPDLVTTQNEYLLALATRDRVRTSEVADAREYADRLVESARRRLQLWDLPADELAALEQRRAPRTSVVFRAPVSGYVIEKHVLPGMRVAAGQTLYRIADLGVVWIEADVYEQDLALVRPLRRAAITLEAYPGERFHGRVIYIHPLVDERTRTARVRFELRNRGLRLKPGMYAHVELQAPLGRVLTVPADAVVDSGVRQIAFVAQGDGRFEPREVRIGQRLEERVQVLEGLEEGEVVASGATFFLDSESQLRAALQRYAAPAPAETGRAAPPQLDIAFRSRPDPPRTGSNTFEVTVRERDGQPVTDAEVAVVFYMPPMPAMNMPAMRSEARLAHAGGGAYRGTGEIQMAGRWEVSVVVSRGGRRIGTRQLTIVAR
jgi:Cu(I)/Ag(I) efflux system membrane fusion protein/cobalt-zinc-cadmium efflux system membrane fusion protein